MALWIPEKIRISVDVNFHFDKLVIEYNDGEVITPEQKAKIIALSEKLAANDDAVAEVLKP